MTTDLSPVYSIGRRKTFLMIWFNLAVCSTACAFATEFWTFAVLRFFCGIFDIGFFLAAFIWGKYFNVVCCGTFTSVRVRLNSENKLRNGGD